MNKDPFEFHRRLHLRRITEDLPYRLAGVKKEKKIISDSSSESSGELDTEFIYHDDLVHDSKKIMKDYTFTKKKKKFDNQLIQTPKTAHSNRSRIDVDLYFNKTPKNHMKTVKSNTNEKANYDLYAFYFDDENKQKVEDSYSNFDSSKSSGFKNIYPFLTEFDYESEEDKLKKEHLKSIHLSGTPLVPSSCKEKQTPSNFSKNHQTVLNDKNECEEETYLEIENWRNFLNNEIYTSNEEAYNNPESKSVTVDNASVVSISPQEESENMQPISKDSMLASKFKEMLKNARPKPISIDSNLQNKVENRVTMKKKTTAFIHNASVTSHLSKTVPISWPSAKKNLFVPKKHEVPLSVYLEKHQGNKLITNDEIDAMGKTIKKVEKQKKIIKEKQNIPDWAMVSGPVMMTAPKKTKVAVKSKFMNESDFIA